MWLMWDFGLCVFACVPFGLATSIKTDILQYSKRQAIECPLYRRNITMLWGLIQQSGCTDKSSRHRKNNHKRTGYMEKGLISTFIPKTEE